MADEAALTRYLALCGPAERDRVLGEMDYDMLDLLGRRWGGWAAAAQCEPEGDWRVWLMLAGRGFGKTRAGAEWVCGLARRFGDTRIALVGATMDEARAVMIEGESGLLAVADPGMRPVWEPSNQRFRWRSGAQAFLYSAERPDGLRGPAHDYAWCDELAKWTHPEATWHNLMLGLRRGARSRVLVTTTPRPVPLLRALIKDEGVAKTFGRTADNEFLPKSYVAAMNALYAGTRLGRQELDGELIEDVAGALWSRDLIETCRVREAPEAVRVVVGVDPPAGAAGSGGDACGIVAVALGGNGCAYVIEDATVSGFGPEGWARAVASAAARHGADRVIAEANNGGAMVASVLRAAEAGLPVKLVHASRGKVARAEPVVALYEHGRAFHAGAFAELEDQLCGLVTGGGYEGPGRSPDRADALVWAMTELMLGVSGAPRVRRL